MGGKGDMVRVGGLGRGVFRGVGCSLVGSGGVPAPGSLLGLLARRGTLGSLTNLLAGPAGFSRGGVRCVGSRQGASVRRRRQIIKND